MVPIALSPIALVLALLLPAYGLPFSKRIDQTTIDSVTPWESACDAAGGGSQCNTIAVNAAATLLAAAGACDQQDSADTMIDLAKTLSNNADVITLAQIFAQQPRNSPTSQAVPYCQSAPRNAELNGLFQCQFVGDDQTTFVGGLAVGAPGTIPFGLSAPVSPPGSCPANPAGPVADGVQLNTLTQNPGVPGASSGSSATATDGDNSAAGGAGASAAASSVATTAAAASTAAPPPATTTAASTSTGAGGFQLQNGQDAQALNAQFAGLTASSACTAGTQACVSGAFAQCVGSAFVLTQCAGGTQCFALPLVNKPGTSIACTTSEDATARIAATGATGGVDGS